MAARRSRRLGAVCAGIFLCSAGLAVVFAGKPGYPDKITWSGVSWDVKTSRSPVGPGPNLFDKANVSVDSAGNLHLRIAKNASGKWTCAEIIGPTYGYGTYSFALASRIDTLDPNVVLGLFTWSDKAPYAHREIDFEAARWGNAADPTNAQYVVQPYDQPLHLKRITQPAATRSTQRFRWQPGQIIWDSYDDTTGALIDTYTYTGTDVPRSGDERVHLNFWLFGGAAPTNSTAAEVVLTSFVFTP